jgi:hypothetical protein
MIKGNVQEFLKSFVKKILTVFGSTYIRKQAFSIMKFGKSKCCLWLTDEHVHDTIHSYSCFKAYIQKLARDTRLWNSHRWA